jgi:hypothetical protein
LLCVGARLMRVVGAVNIGDSKISTFFEDDKVAKHLLVSRPRYPRGRRKWGRRPFEAEIRGSKNFKLRKKKLK